MEFTPRFSTLTQALSDSIARHGGRPIFGTRQKDGEWSWITYSEFGALVDAFRSALADLGVGPGDKVAVISNNRLEWAVGCYATYGRGACYVPMYEAQLDRDWQYILEDSGAKLCLVSSRGAPRTNLHVGNETQQQRKRETEKVRPLCGPRDGVT